MTYAAKTVAEYLEALPEDRRPAIARLREAVLKNLPEGFAEVMSYGHIGYVVPHGLYPKGYHCTPQLPLPFMGIASQKNFIGIYHMGIYVAPTLMDWFTSEYAARVRPKLDMGKSCLRFKKPGDIPFDLIGELASKMTPADWIAVYESKFRKK